MVVDIEKAVAGGRMLARHEGRIVLLWGAIPGERVHARVDRVAKGVVYATTTEVIQASPDRRAVSGDWRCGGSVYAHIAYPRQRLLKGDVLVDAMARIGRLPLSAPPIVAGSPEAAYRMRARLHVRNRRVGLYREESHDICDACATGQFLPDTERWIGRLQARLASGTADAIVSVEIAENVAGSERVCHLDLRAGADAAVFTALSGRDVTGLTVARAASMGSAPGRGVERGLGRIDVLAGSPTVTDVLHVSDSVPQTALTLRRDVRAFFQGNRFLLEPLVRHVVARVPAGPVLDLYAGVGLFGLAVAACRAGGVGPGAASSDERVTLVEGDPISGADLQRNAEPFGDRVAVHRMSVEAFLGAAPAASLRASAAEGVRLAWTDTTLIVDPPRTGMTRDVVAAIVERRPPRIVFVSCDPATLARDVRACREAGYELSEIAGFDLFPNTAHVETVAVLTDGSKP